MFDAIGCEYMHEFIIYSGFCNIDFHKISSFLFGYFLFLHNPFQLPHVLSFRHSPYQEPVDEIPEAQAASCKQFAEAFAPVTDEETVYAEHP